MFTNFHAMYTSVLCLVFINGISAHQGHQKYFGRYFEQRQNIIDSELRKSVGGQVGLSDKEIKANDILMRLKYQEIDHRKPENFNLSRHYFTYKDHIQNSKVYQIIRRMPKGAVLHVHSSMMLGSDYLLKLTYHDNLYACYTDGKLEDMLFSDSVPQRPCSSKWELMQVLRNASGAVDQFDKDLQKHFTLYTEHVNLDTDINTTWRKFDKVHRAIKSLISFRPVREKYFYDALQRFHGDNIQYVEIRSGLSELYELNGTRHDKMELARLYKRVTEQFVADHHDFIGIKLIYTRHRSTNLKEVRESLEMARKLSREMPEYFAGFDLVGQEDKGKPLVDFLPALLEAKDEIDFYFHGGETNWFGTSSDENLIDAILLGSKRIGHGYALMKHPYLLEVVRKRGIAIEVNVISNAVLSLIHDVRNHPLSLYLALGLPMVLSSDDPGAWDSEPLSHDFYVAFMGVASKKSDIRTLKQLALNSIKYSSLNINMKKLAYETFHQKWNFFINDLIADEAL